MCWLGGESGSGYSIEWNLISQGGEHMSHEKKSTHLFYFFGRFIVVYTVKFEAPTDFL